jgi:hypothetical protein
MRFREALSTSALEEYGTMGKLILKGEIEEPKEPNRVLFDLDNEYEKLDYLEEMKTYRKIRNDQREKKPKLYATILKYLSEESLEVVIRVKEWSEVEENIDPEKLWSIIVDKHRVHSTSEVAAVVKLEARNQLQSLKQGGFESIISYKQRYTSALKAYHDQGNPTKDDSDQAMDFFHGLDNGKYAEFKVQYLNGLQVGSIAAPRDLNTIFTVANNWLKPKALAGGGYASTYATRVDNVEKKQEGGKKDAKSKEKKQGDANQQEGKDGKAKQRARKLECFICGDEHYASNCPLKKKTKEKEQQDAFVNAAWEANVFSMSLTYQVNAVGLGSFSETEVLLDNQADISIMRPSMLRELRTLKSSVQVNGVGGVQMEVCQVGYLH